MRHLLDTTELLIASWILGGGDDQIPTSHGILDRALKAAVKDRTCPSWVRDQLHFVDSRIGLHCVEFPALLDWAQRAQLTSAPNPSYQSTQVQISDKAARKILLDLDVTEESAIQWGTLLRQIVDEMSSSMAAKYRANRRGALSQLIAAWLGSRLVDLWWAGNQETRH